MDSYDLWLNRVYARIDKMTAADPRTFAPLDLLGSWKDDLYHRPCANYICPE